GGVLLRHFGEAADPAVLRRPEAPFFHEAAAEGFFLKGIGMASKSASNMASKKIVVAHLGARRHYAEICMLASSGRLEHFFTDICSGKGVTNLLNFLPLRYQSDSVKRLLHRAPPKLPKDLITHFPGFGLRYAWLRSRARSHSALTAAYLW